MGVVYFRTPLGSKGQCPLLGHVPFQGMCFDEGGRGVRVGFVGQGTGVHFIGLVFHFVVFFGEGTGG